MCLCGGEKEWVTERGLQEICFHYLSLHLLKIHSESIQLCWNILRHFSAVWNNWLILQPKGSGLGLPAPSTSMAAHAIDELVEIEAEENIEVVETASGKIDKGASTCGVRRLPFLLPPPLPVPRNTYSQVGSVIDHSFALVLACMFSLHLHKRWLGYVDAFLAILSKCKLRSSLNWILMRALCLRFGKSLCIYFLSLHLMLSCFCLYYQHKGKDENVDVEGLEEEMVEVDIVWIHNACCWGFCFGIFLLSSDVGSYIIQRQDEEIGELHVDSFGL